MADSVVEEAVDHAVVAKDVLRDRQRFMTPKPAHLPLTGAEIANRLAKLVPPTVPMPVLRWAETYHRTWWRAAKATSNGPRGSVLMSPCWVNRAWLCVDTYKHTGRFVRCEHDELSGALTPIRPMESVSSLDLFTKFRSILEDHDDDDYIGLEVNLGSVEWAKLEGESHRLSGPISNIFHVKRTPIAPLNDAKRASKKPRVLHCDYVHF